MRRHRGLIANQIAQQRSVDGAFLYTGRSASADFRRELSGCFRDHARAIDELTQQTKGATRDSTVYPHPIAFNLLPHVDSFLESGYTKEEMKMQNEACKIMHLPQFCASVTCVRVPVYRAHSVAVSAEFEKRFHWKGARGLAKRRGSTSWTNRRIIVIRCHAKRYGSLRLTVRLKTGFVSVSDRCPRAQP
jgi:aspartate-semialdehyde dehydrogenase